MDANSTTPQTPAPVSPQQPAAQASQPAVPQVPVSSMPANGSNKIIIYFVVGLVAIVLAVGGVYFYLSRQQVQAPTPQPTIPTVQTSPSPSTAAGLQNDLNNVNAEVATDLTPVDQDLQQL